jgi:hypothetical protein
MEHDPHFAASALQQHQQQHLDPRAFSRPPHEQLAAGPSVSIDPRHYAPQGPPESHYESHDLHRPHTNGGNGEPLPLGQQEGPHHRTIAQMAPRPSSRETGDSVALQNLAVQALEQKREGENGNANGNLDVAGRDGGQGIDIVRD